MKLIVDQQLVPKKERLEETLLHSIEKVVSEVVPSIPSDATVALVFVTDDVIQSLNKTYRGKDEVTDVLSFTYDQNEHAEIFGDIAISYDQVVRQQNYGIRSEMITLIVHGILHVFGFDHMNEKDAQEMFSYQDAIVAELI